MNLLKKSEFIKIKQLLQDKLSPGDFQNINWDTFSVQTVANKNNLFTFTFKNDKRKRLFAIKDGKSYGLQLDSWTIDRHSLSYTRRNLNTNEEKTFQKSISEILSKGLKDKSKLSLLDEITLPEVVVIAYITQGSNWINFNIYNQLIQGWIPTGGGSLGYSSIYESLPPDGGGGGQIYLGPILEFVNDEEALAFFMWAQDANPQEAALIALFPVQALQIYRNSRTAFAKTEAWVANHPGIENSLTDGRADALRHAYWNALNTSDVGSVIAKLFGDAHEFGNTSPQDPTALSNFYVSRQMDLHNNAIGSQLAINQGWGLFTSAQTIWDYFEISYLNSSLSTVYICKLGAVYIILTMYEPCI
ncbi:MAG: hypothetical protein WKF35_12270 [Ferruginibacter sp.]